METVKKLENLTISGDLIWSVYDTFATTQRNGVKCQVNLGSMVDNHATNLAQHFVYKPVYSLMIGGVCASDDTTLLSNLVSLIKEQVQVSNNKHLASELKKLFNDA